MKKTAALLMLSSIAYSKDFNIKFKSDAEYIVNSKEYIYRPVDLKIFSKDNKYGYFLKIRGTSEKFALYDDEIVLIDMDTVRINDEVKKVILQYRRSIVIFFQHTIQLIIMVHMNTMKL